MIVLIGQRLRSWQRFGNQFCYLTFLFEFSLNSPTLSGANILLPLHKNERKYGVIKLFLIATLLSFLAINAACSSTQPLRPTIAHTPALST